MTLYKLMEQYIKQTSELGKANAKLAYLLDTIENVVFDVMTHPYFEIKYLKTWRDRTLKALMAMDNDHQRADSKEDREDV